MTNAMLHHFDASISEAASRMKMVLDTFTGISRLSYNKESFAIIKLLEYLKGSLAGDVTTIGLTSWLNELEAKNKAFEKLFVNRYDETTSKTVMKPP
ncbi:MAG: DUF6261 family protein [Microbacter sp.]